MFINNSHNDTAEVAIYLVTNATVFQTEVFAVERALFELTFVETRNNHVINCDSQSAIVALDSTKIKSKTTLAAVLALNKLREKQVLIRWIPAHSGYVEMYRLLPNKEPITLMQPSQICLLQGYLGRGNKKEDET